MDYYKTRTPATADGIPPVHHHAFYPQHVRENMGRNEHKIYNSISLNELVFHMYFVFHILSGNAKGSVPKDCRRDPVRYGLRGPEAGLGRCARRSNPID